MHVVGINLVLIFKLVYFLYTLFQIIYIIYIQIIYKNEFGLKNFNQNQIFFQTLRICSLAHPIISHSEQQNSI